MGLPSIDIVFKSKGASALKRGERGIVALILREDGVPTGIYNISSVVDIPSGISEKNKKQIELARMGNTVAPKKVVIVVVPTADLDYTNAFKLLRTVKFNYVAFPDIIETQTMTIVAEIKSMRDVDKQKVIAVLPNVVGDYEGIVNFTADEIEVEGVVFNTGDYCGRIAGLLAGTPLQISATYSVLPEVTDVKRFTKEELNTKIDNGEFVLFHDGEKVKVGRAITSLTTISQEKGEDYKKVKIVSILDMVYMDIRQTMEDSYIGKYANSYDNKVILANAIKGYLLGLESEVILDEGKNDAYINIDAQKAYLRSIGVDVDNMSEIEIKEANTKDKTFIAGTVKPLDAIEDIDLEFYN